MERIYVTVGRDPAPGGLQVLSMADLRQLVEECKTFKVYEPRTKEIVASAVRGFNGTVFAYGQTNSGKTHTMRGSGSEPGIISLSVHDLFQSIRELATVKMCVRDGQGRHLPHSSEELMQHDEVLVEDQYSDSYLPDKEINVKLICLPSLHQEVLSAHDEELGEDVKIWSFRACQWFGWKIKKQEVQSAVQQKLNQICPLANLRHVKRVCKQIIEDGRESRESLRL